MTILPSVRRLWLQSHPPLVTVGPSRLTGAGKGVFVASDYLPSGTVLCLYRGVYTPPLPPHASFDVDATQESASCYLGNRVAPNGQTIEENAYILNLQDVGGYIDGSESVGSTEHYDNDDDPFVCAHLVNHHANCNNVTVVSFRWDDVLRLTKGVDSDNCHKTGMQQQHPCALPNKTRTNDDSAWYLDGQTGTIVTFRDCTAPVCGAAFVARHDLEQGQELYLDYGLHPPYPTWAKDWYEAAG